MSGARGERRSVRALEAGYLGYQMSIVHVDNHQATGARDEEAMVRRVGGYIVPTAVATQRIRMSNCIRLRRQRVRGENKIEHREQGETLHLCFSRKEGSSNGFTRAEWVEIR